MKIDILDDVYYVNSLVKHTQSFHILTFDNFVKNRPIFYRFAVTLLPKISLVRVALANVRDCNFHKLTVIKSNFLTISHFVIHECLRIE